MIDPVLEEEIRCVGDVIGMWNDLFAHVAKARAGGGVSGDSARAFLSLRDKIAGLYAATMARLEVVPDAQDELVQLLGRMGSLEAVAAIPDAQWKKLEEAGVRVTVGLQGLAGVLQNRQRALEGVDGGRLVMRRILGSWPCKLLCLAGGIILIFIVVNKIILYTKWR